MNNSLTKEDGHFVVFDTVIEDLSEDSFPDRLGGKGPNPKNAAREFLKFNDQFGVDKEIKSKLPITVAPAAYLRCVKD